MGNLRKIRPFSLFILAAALIILTGQSALAADAGPNIPGKITTTGQAEFTVAPDMATVVVGVSALEATALKAQSSVAASMAALQKTLSSLGVPERQIQTRSFNVGPEYEYVNGKRNLVGYRAGHDLHIRLDDLSRMGAVLDAVVAAGATEVRNVQFGLKDDRAVLYEALELAVRDARLKAEALAAGAGGKATRITRIYDQSGSNVVIPMERSGFGVMAAVADAGTQIAQGEIVIRASVEVEFELEQ